jgi:predicted nucleic acid-binding protein
MWHWRGETLGSPMIVVDSNVLAYLYLPTEYTTAVEALLEHEPDWAAPILWRSEFRNILAGYMRRKTISFEQANSLQREAERLLEGSEFEVDSQVVLELVRDSDCSAYDCEFIALAIKLDVKLVTMDKKLLRAFPKRAIALPAG